MRGVVIQLNQLIREVANGEQSPEETTASEAEWRIMLLL
jgi:hypothetical protein